jgi:hypothetical protein
MAANSSPLAATLATDRLQNLEGTGRCGQRFLRLSLMHNVKISTLTGYLPAHSKAIMLRANGKRSHLSPICQTGSKPRLSRRSRYIQSTRRRSAGRSVNIEEGQSLRRISRRPNRPNVSAAGRGPMEAQFTQTRVMAALRRVIEGDTMEDPPLSQPYRNANVTMLTGLTGFASKRANASDDRVARQTWMRRRRQLPSLVAGDHGSKNRHALTPETGKSASANPFLKDDPMRTSL